MKVLTNGFYSLILFVLDFDNQIKDLNESSSSFDHIIDLPQVASIFEGDIDEFSFNELIDTLFKIETEMNRFITKGKVITDTRWQDFFGELATTKTCEWPTIREVIVWEEIT